MGKRRFPRVISGVMMIFFTASLVFPLAVVSARITEKDRELLDVGYRVWERRDSQFWQWVDEAGETYRKIYGSEPEGRVDGRLLSLAWAKTFCDFLGPKCRELLTPEDIAHFAYHAAKSAIQFPRLPCFIQEHKAFSDHITLSCRGVEVVMHKILPGTSLDYKEPPSKDEPKIHKWSPYMGSSTRRLTHKLALRRAAPMANILRHKMFIDEYGVCGKGFSMVKCREYIVFGLPPISVRNLVSTTLAKSILSSTTKLDVSAANIDMFLIEKTYRLYYEENAYIEQHGLEPDTTATTKNGRLQFIVSDILPPSPDGALYLTLIDAFKNMQIYHPVSFVRIATAILASPSLREISP